jgi:hypothetical protein
LDPFPDIVEDDLKIYKTRDSVPQQNLVSFFESSLEDQFRRQIENSLEKTLFAPAGLPTPLSVALDGQRR